MSGAMGAGDFIPWDGGCLLIGRGTSIIPLHAHYAIQIAFNPEYGIRFRPSEKDEWTEYHAAVIPSRQPHEMDATRADVVAVLLVEPETPQGRAIDERWLADGITTIPAEVMIEAGPALFETWRNGGSRDAVVEAARHVITTLAGGVTASTASDERILRAITYIRTHLDTPLTLEAVAGEACLSPSRFRHLFVEQTGTALRPYVLWRRFIRAWEVVMHGESLSTAAHEAGFADAAHLTRTSVRMFGFPPSALQLNVKRETLRSEAPLVAR